jgi:hypothetical protein
MNQGGRIRGSSSGAFVGENIAGLGAIGKSQSNILKDNERVGLQKGKYNTHAQDSKKSADASGSLSAARNLQLHRITSQQDRQIQQQILSDQMFKGDQRE